MPRFGRDQLGFAELAEVVCRREGVREIVVPDALAALARAALSSRPTAVRVRAHSALGAAPIARPDPRGFHLVQHSSGSTGAPKGIELDDAALGSNVTALLAATGATAGDGTVSWLPLSHDMGLVGMLLTGVAAGAGATRGRSEVHLMEPGRFLRSPASWVQELSDRRASITAAPDMGYRLVIDHGAAPAVDLSRLRCAIVGGEVVRASTLQRLTAALAPLGLSPSAPCPAYGLSEVGLGVSLTPPGAGWRELALDGDRVIDRSWRHGSAPTSGGGRAGGLRSAVVASGVPLAGYDVGVAGESRTGRLLVRGPSIGRHPGDGASLAGPDGWLDTGDLGAVVDGWVVVTGRADDLLVVHGLQVHAPALEDDLARVPGVRAGRVLAVTRPTGEWVVLAESERGADPATLRSDLAVVAVRHAGARPDEVTLVRRGQLPTTPSGKLRRGEALARLLRGELEEAWHRPVSSAPRSTW